MTKIKICGLRREQDIRYANELMPDYIGFVFLKIVLTNTLKVAATYTGTLLVLLFLSEKAYLKMVSAIGAWAVVIILLIGVDMMLSSVYDH